MGSTGSPLLGAMMLVRGVPLVTALTMSPPSPVYIGCPVTPGGQSIRRALD